ncbi:MAG: polyprenyl synthetase family protein [Acidobacteria bacterium]|nr:polyprenyl synthetase family protein [Acidobacteriota bacterium]
MSTVTPDQIETPAEPRIIPLQLPMQVPRQVYRQAQSNIPDDKLDRVRLKKIAEDYVASVGAIPPLTLDELTEHTGAVLAASGLDPIYKDYTSILVSNAAWRESLAQIPYDRRLLLIPKCLRVEEKCPAPFDEFGLLCKECGLCSIQDLTVEAERLGYAVLVAEGSAIVRSMIETGKIEAIVGVSCINVLEKCFPHMEAAAIPGVAIPLLQDDCINTTVDLDWVWDLIHLTSDDKTYRLDLDGLKTTVRSWFESETLNAIMGEAVATDDTARIARTYLEKGGNRWRPYLAACTYMALEADRQETDPVLTAAVKKAAVAIECFHKASLIHDDIEDSDERRYDSPALHTEVGVPVALNIGDFLVGEGYRLLSELGNADVIAVAAQGHVTLSRGQGRELLWARDPQPLGSMEVLDIFRQKTSAAFEVALRVGAMLGQADERTHDVLRHYSEALGIAYQIKDDLEDFRGEADSDDLAQVRLSLILAIAHKRAEGSDRERIASVIRHGASDGPEDVRRIANEYGVLDKTEDLLEAYKEESIRALRFLSSPTLKGLMRRIVGKIFGEKLIEGYCSEFETRNAAGRAPGAESVAGSV